MTADKPRVTVYAFMTLDGGVEFARMAPFKATREVIRDRFKGSILEGTAQLVDADELDDHGRLERLPTGWGDLPN